LNQEQGGKKMEERQIVFATCEAGTLTVYVQKPCFCAVIGKSHQTFPGVFDPNNEQDWLNCRNFFRKHKITEMRCSSSLDFAEDYGVNATELRKMLAYAFLWPQVS
jgi:hypothetical protein